MYSEHTRRTFRRCNVSLNPKVVVARFLRLSQHNLLRFAVRGNSLQRCQKSIRESICPAALPTRRRTLTGTSRPRAKGLRLGARNDESIRTISSLSSQVVDTRSVPCRLLGTTTYPGAVHRSIQLAIRIGQIPKTFAQPLPRGASAVNRGRCVRKRRRIRTSSGLAP